MERLAGRNQLRFVEKSKCFLGIQQGVIVELLEWDGVVTAKLSSPTADIGDQVLEDFAGFVKWHEAGLPTSWISALMEKDASGHESISKRGCSVLVDGKRLESIGIDRFLEITTLLAQDLHAHGASETLRCTECGKKEAVTVALANYAYTPLCDGCWQDLQFHAAAGKLATQQSVKWPLVLAVLSVLTVSGGMAWGFLQQPERLNRFGFYAMLLPAVWAYGLCWAIKLVGGGVTPLLRVTLCGSVILSVLAGNMWGYRSFVIQQMEKRLNQPVLGPRWADSAQLYFSALPDMWRSEAPFYAGGLIGAWIGLRLLKSEETIDLR
ncbi:MAG: hypothetical protein ACHRXM_07705 [Isosphaerales bacterium]